MLAQYQEYWTRYILPYTYPAPEVLQFLGGKAPAYVTINWEPLWLLKLNYALESHCLFTLSLHWQLTSKAQNGNHSSTLLYHWAGLNVTTLPWCWVILRYVLSLRRPLPYGRTNGQTDKNRQTIAVTLHLRFAARVNYESEWLSQSLDSLRMQYSQPFASKPQE